MTETLFSIPADEVATTSDDCYTPRWVFDAMGLRFDLDVAAPVGGPWHVPCGHYYTAENDGLAMPWYGTVWCNPPYSNFAPWAERFASHRLGVALMGIVLPEVRWFPVVFAAADAVALISCDFSRPDGKSVRLRQQVFVAFRGIGAGPAERLAAADRYGACALRQECRMTARLTAADIQARVVVTPDGCWEYPGKGDSRGYRFCGGDRAHRTSYRLHVGEIPAGLQIDHLCRNTGCVNPDHLEPVTNAENMRRRAAARTHCRHGHPWSPTNTRINCRGAKVCRECDRVIRRRYYQRRAERLSA